MKCVLSAWGQVKRGFEVLALGEMCFEGMGQLKGGFHPVPTRETPFSTAYKHPRWNIMKFVATIFLSIFCREVAT